jgi:glycosyltransferase involved in cell wall biosynthesis
MRRVLIVTGSYAPTMIADMHRARQLAWRLPELGWDVEILCPGQCYQPASCRDDDSAAFFAAGTAVHEVPRHLARLFGVLGVGGIGIRAIVPALCEGGRLLRKLRYDLVYISTAQFPLFLLGPAWQRRYGIPFVLDLHDPICAQPAKPPAGLKQRLGRALSKQVEARAVTTASGLISVSPNYLDELCRRYAHTAPRWLTAGRRAVIPFAVLPQDLQEAARGMPAPGVDGLARIIYVGTGGPIMVRSFSLLCRALSHLRAHRPDLVERVRIELRGTASAVGHDAIRHLAAVASGHGLADIVSEDPTRVTYRRSLELLLGADGALILGVDDAGYMPSKLFTYAYSGKPVLASLHRGCPALAAFRKFGLARALWFDDAEAMTVADAADLVTTFLEDVIGRRQSDRRSDLEPYSASAMAQRHAEVFEACLR